MENLNHLAPSLHRTTSTTISIDSSTRRSYTIFPAEKHYDIRMPKRKKSKRPKTQDVSELAGLSNLTGFSDAGGSSLDDCMAEMMFQGQTPKISKADDSTAGDTTAQCDTADTTSKKDGKSRQPSWIQQANKQNISSKTMMSAEDVENWNRNFLTWAKGGLYEPGLLPNIDQEINRNFKVKELSTLLLKNEDVAGKDLRMPVFERWLLDSKHEEVVEGINGDCVLPLQSSPDAEASQRLLTELVKQNGIEEDDAEKIIAKLCRTTNLMCQELLSQDDRYRRQSPLKKGDRLNMTLQSSNGVVSFEYSRKRWKKPFCFKLNISHYNKLKDRFLEIHPNLMFGNKTAKNHVEAKIERSFHILVLALLLRYSALSGGGLLDDLRGGGMQGAIHSSVFEVLQTHFSRGRNTASKQFWFEGFASPFNATLPHFASAFPDLDWHFGSVGRFLDCRFDGESDSDSGGEYCEANPPFSPGIMFSMANHMLETLERAEERGFMLTFVVVVPSIARKKSKSDRNDSTAVAKHLAEKSFRRMTASSYCTKHIQLNAREHGYVEGAQHLRPTQYKESSYDTSVIILQSRGGENESNLKELEKNLRSAFSSRHKTELMERKRKASS